MLINIPEKLVDSSSTTQGTHNIAFWNGLCLSRAFTLQIQILSKSTSKHPGAQLQMLIIIPVLS
jgi:hypothetical protein